MYNATILFLLALSTACQGAQTTSLALQDVTPPSSTTQSITTTEAAKKPAALNRVEIKGMSPATQVGNIWLAGQPSQAALAQLQRQGLQTVIDLRGLAEDRGYNEAQQVSDLGLRYVPLPVSGASDLTDALFDQGRMVLRRFRGVQKNTGKGLQQKSVLLHCASSNRVGAVWLVSRVLDEGVQWNTALEEARAVGLRTPALVSAAQEYVLGAGRKALGRYKLQIRERFPKVATIDVSALAKRMKAGSSVLLLDVREAKEFAVSHLRGAQHAGDLEQALKALKGRAKNADIVVYCSIGYRSASLAKGLNEAGYTGVMNLEGSIFEWANTGHPVYRAQTPVQEVHPYDKEWGKLLKQSLWSKIK